MKTKGFANVIAGVDGRQGGHDAVALAGQLAASGARVTLAHVHNTAWGLGKANGTGVPLGLENVEPLLQVELSRTPIEAEAVSIAATPPARGLHELAEQTQADLLVVGSSPHALVGRLLLGNVAWNTFHGAP